MQKNRLITFMIIGMALLFVGLAPMPNLGSDRPASDKQDAASAAATAKPAAESQDAIAALQQQMALQKKQIEQLQKALAEQEQLLEQARRAAKPAAAAEQAAAPESSNLGQVASTTPMVHEHKSAKPARTFILRTDRSPAVSSLHLTSS